MVCGRWRDVLHLGHFLPSRWGSYAGVFRMDWPASSPFSQWADIVERKIQKQKNQSLFHFKTQWLFTGMEIFPKDTFKINPGRSIFCFTKDRQWTPILKESEFTFFLNIHSRFFSRFTSSNCNSQLKTVIKFWDDTVMDKRQWTGQNDSRSQENCWCENRALSHSFSNLFIRENFQNNTLGRQIPGNFYLKQWI